MKTLRLLSILFFASLLVACSDDDDVGATEFDGSIESLETFYTPELVQALEDLGFVVNQGSNPPNIEGKFFSSPIRLQASTVPGDFEGQAFNDYTSTFSNLNLNNLTLDFLGEESNAVTNGEGSLISGENDEFSVYLKTTTQNQESIVVSTAVAISGRLTSEGIENFQLAILMLDDNGDPDDIYIDNNTGRLLFDNDFFSPKID